MDCIVFLNILFINNLKKEVKMVTCKNKLKLVAEYF